MEICAFAQTLGYLRRRVEICGGPRRSDAICAGDTLLGVARRCYVLLDVVSH